MNLQETLDLTALNQPLSKVSKVSKEVKPKTKTAVQVARKVFQLAAAGGFPYKYHTPESWARKWLKSKEFVLMEIDINASAMVGGKEKDGTPKPVPKNPNRVLHYMQCSADAIEPIVVDINKRKQGRTANGYFPEVVTHDGKHRQTAQIRQGRTRIMAWVGIKAAAKIKNVGRTINASIEVQKAPPVGLHSTINRIRDTYEIYATTVPATGLANSTMRQDTGEAGPRPKNMESAKKNGLKSAGGGGAAGGASNGGGSGSNPLRMGVMENGGEDCNACGARSSGSLESSDSSDDLVGNPKWNADKPQNFAPGTGPGYSDRFGSPNIQSPGSGTGPRVKNKGSSKSDYARQLNAGHKTGCMCAECKTMGAATKVGNIFNKKKVKKSVRGKGR